MKKHGTCVTIDGKIKKSKVFIFSKFVFTMIVSNFGFYFETI